MQYNDRQQQAEQLAALVARQLSAGLAARSKATLAVPGGTTPGPFLQALAATGLDWKQVAITLSDERQVAPDHERSNAKLLQDHFISAASGVKFVPLYSADSDHGQRSADEPANNADPVSMALQTHCLPLDVCVLGMGADGHFASLFPAAANLAAGLNPDNPAALIMINAGNIPEPRVSLTLASILSARHLHLLITGEEKQAVLRQAEGAAKCSENPQTLPTLPIQALLQHAGERLDVHYTA